MSLLTHNEIRTAVIATLKADTSVNAAIKGWYRYLLPSSTRYPAVYVGEIVQPLVGACGTDQQYTTIADMMKITTGILCSKQDNDAADDELGTVYELVYDAFGAAPTLGLSNFKIHSITPISTNPAPQYGKFTIGAEITLNTTWEE